MTLGSAMGAARLGALQEVPASANGLRGWEPGVIYPHFLNFNFATNSRYLCGFSRIRYFSRADLFPTIFSSP